MLLVPKQLQRAGMTGNVPYYGGRFTPAQAYAASHPSAPPPAFPDLMTTGGAFVRAPVPARGTDYPAKRSPAKTSPAKAQPDTQVALQHLLDAGVITQAEFQELRARVIK
jgi:hypothetical protein